MKIKILLAEDHAIVREGLRLVLEGIEDLEVIGEAMDGFDAISETQRLKPDVVVMDLFMPDMNGIEATEQIRRDCPATQVVILSLRGEVEDVVRALRAGARSYIVKESASDELITAIRAVHAGQRYLSNKLAIATIEAYLEHGDPLAGNPLSKLSLRERQLLQLVAEGDSNAEIARKLHVSVKSVETYRSRIKRKLSISRLVDLLKACIRWGLTREP